jgi:hypothetical protein
MHELTEKGISDWRLALALCRVHSDADATFARDYLRQASYRPLKGELREKKAFADLQNVGQAVTEGPASLSREAQDLIDSIAAALMRAQRKDRAEREAQGPARLVRSNDTTPSREVCGSASHRPASRRFKRWSAPLSQAGASRRVAPSSSISASPRKPRSAPNTLPPNTATPWAASSRRC